MENRLARNRRSPSNEDKYVKAYLEKNPSARKKDGLDCKRWHKRRWFTSRRI